MRAHVAPLRAAELLLPSLLLASTLVVTGLPRQAPAPAPIRATPVAASTSTPAPGGFASLPGARILDTRTRPDGAAPIPKGGIRRLVVIGKGGVPTRGASAVTLRVTALAPQKAGYFSVYPGGTARPIASSLNFLGGASVTVANLVTTKLGSDGSVNIYNGSPGRTHVLVDVLGYYTAPHPHRWSGEFTAVQPARLVDTRQKHWGAKPYQPNQAYAVAVVGHGGLPTRGLSAVALNVTVLKPTTGGQLTIGPTATTTPATTTMSFVHGQVLATATTSQVGKDGRVYVTSTGGPYHLVVDVVGWYADGSQSNIKGYAQGTAPTGLFRPVTAARSVDRRGQASGQTPLPANSILRVLVPDSAGVPRTGVSAVVLSVTVPLADTKGYLKVYPADATVPAASALNFGGTVPSTAAVVVPVAADGVINVLNGSSGVTQLQIDVLGWFTNPPLAPVGAPIATWPKPPATPGSDVDLAQKVLLNSNRYAIQSWWPNIAQQLMNEPLDSGTPNLGSRGNPLGDPVRRLGMEAFGLATAKVTGALNANTVGQVDPNGISHVDSVIMRIVDRLASTHIANVANGWGGGWQGSLWASMVGRAAWLDWGILSSTQRLKVARMVEYEADNILATRVRYLRNPAGSILSPGDSGAEEDAWYALAPELAQVMLPTHPHFAAWQQKTVQLLVAAWSAPQDESDPDIATTRVNGATLGQWLNGTNLEPDGSIVNHCRIAPDYTTNAYQNVDAALMFSLARKPTPVAAFRGLDRAYAALSTNTYTAGTQDPDPATQCNNNPPQTYALPGGSVYAPGSSSIYYPEGSDWGTGQELPFALIDTQASAFGFDQYAAPDRQARDMASLHLNAQYAMQQRYSDGHTYADDTEYNYVGKEEHVAQLAAALWLTQFVRDRRMLSLTDASYWTPAFVREYSRFASGSAEPPMYESRLQHG